LFHIDFSQFSKKATEQSDQLSINQVEYENLFNSIIVNKINKNHCNYSACFLCNSEAHKNFPVDPRNIIELECNGLLNTEFCEVPFNISENIFPEDFIIVKSEDFLEIAQVKLIGEIVKIKRRSIGLFGETLPEIVRKATFEDLEKVRKNFDDEVRAFPIFKKAIKKFNLDMKIVSIHFQFDRKKLYFFYTADGRVDFRELAKELASEFKTRIELRQIGVRDEAKKIGGLGSCGRELCCICFLPSFKRITTQLANEQNLLSSMGKLSGPCGKLKCCLSFEIE
jgi:cell fate regulator YaaT (PSP1 superfamily)